MEVDDMWDDEEDREMVKSSPTRAHKEPQGTEEPCQMTERAALVRAEGILSYLLDTCPLERVVDTNELNDMLRARKLIRDVVQSGYADAPEPGLWARLTVDDAMVERAVEAFEEEEGFQHAGSSLTVSIRAALSAALALREAEV